MWIEVLLSVIEYSLYDYIRRCPAGENQIRAHQQHVLKALEAMKQMRRGSGGVEHYREGRRDGGRRTRAVSQQQTALYDGCTVRDLTVGAERRIAWDFKNTFHLDKTLIFSPASPCKRDAENLPRKLMGLNRG
jgi:hypothetical protein